MHNSNTQRPLRCLGRMCLNEEHCLQMPETWWNVFSPFNKRYLFLKPVEHTVCNDTLPIVCLLGFSKCNYSFLSWVKLLVLNSLKVRESFPLNFNFPGQLLSSGTLVHAQNSFADCTQLLWVYTSIWKGRIWFYRQSLWLKISYGPNSPLDW